MHAAVRAVVTISGSGFPSGCCVCWSLAISRSGRTGAALQGRVLLGAGGQAAPSACLTPPFRLRGFPAFPPQGRVLRVSASAGSPRSLPKAGFPAFPPQGRVLRVSASAGSPRSRPRAGFPAFPPQGRLPCLRFSPGPLSTLGQGWEARTRPVVVLRPNSGSPGPLPVSGRGRPCLLTRRFWPRASLRE